MYLFLHRTHKRGFVCVYKHECIFTDWIDTILLLNTILFSPILPSCNRGRLENKQSSCDTTPL